jgi:hypothetical protein
MVAAFTWKEGRLSVPLPKAAWIAHISGNPCCPMAALAALSSIGDRPRLVARPSAPCRRRRLSQHALHARQRPMEIHRRRAGRAEHGEHVVQCGSLASAARPERHAVGGGGADQRRTAHLHDAYGVGGVFERCQA